MPFETSFGTEKGDTVEVDSHARQKNAVGITFPARKPTTEGGETKEPQNSGSISWIDQQQRAYPRGHKFHPTAILMSESESEFPSKNSP